jgi:hypothetical protein
MSGPDPISEAAANSEAASEKRKRGRPTVIPPSAALFRLLWNDRISTERGMQNQYYAQGAIKALKLLPDNDIPSDLRWLVDWDGAC